MSLYVPVTGLWIHDYYTPTDAVRLPLMPQWGEDLEVPGEEQLFAGGVVRSILDEGQMATLTPALRMVTGAGVAQVKRRAGRAQWFRTSTGLRFAGIYRKPSVVWVLPPAPDGSGGLARVAFTVTALGGTDAV